MKCTQCGFGDGLPRGTPLSWTGKENTANFPVKWTRFQGVIPDDGTQETKPVRAWSSTTYGYLGMPVRRDAEARYIQASVLTLLVTLNCRIPTY